MRHRDPGCVLSSRSVGSPFPPNLLELARPVAKRLTQVGAWYIHQHGLGTRFGACVDETNVGTPTTVAGDGVYPLGSCLRLPKEFPVAVEIADVAEPIPKLARPYVAVGVYNGDILSRRANHESGRAFFRDRPTLC